MTTGDPRWPRSGAQRETEEDDLAESLQGLAVLSTAIPLEQVLTRVARYAVLAIPGADGAGLTLNEPESATMLIATAGFVRDVDAVQASTGEGPCITAAREGMTIIAGELSSDPRWPRFGSRIAGMGVRSALSLPLLVGHEIVGAMNVYAHAGQAFDERAAELGEIFAAPAAVAVQNARVLAEARRTTQRLQTALDERVLIERAVGIVMSRSGVDEAEALARLTTLSEGAPGRARAKLVQVARSVVEEAVRRAGGNLSG